jgi:DNA-binding GntR family transcriptional regulator
MTLDRSQEGRRSRAAEAAEGARATSPLYAMIGQVLRRAILDGSIEEGAVILEGPIAEILRSTRTPVRQALQELEEDGIVSRFDGRGYVAGPPGTPPRRVKLEAAMLGLDDGAGPVRKTLGWEAIYDEVERDLVHLSVFDAYRVNELELARHYGVSRTVARDVLLRLERLGLLEKDERLRWVVQPLDANRINHLYELRWLLEPVALRGAVGATPAGDVERMTNDLRRAIEAYPRISRTQMDDLERDLHVTLLSRCPNRDLLQSLERTHCLLTVSKHVLGVSAPMPKHDPFMSEHRSILDSVARGDVGRAENMLRKHLEDSCLKLIRRIDSVRTNYAAPKPPYINERSGSD